MSIRVRSGMKLPPPDRRPDTRFETVVRRFVVVLAVTAVVVLAVGGSIAGAVAVSLFWCGFGILWSVP
jgi:hypothetical protein